jgi:hypothetical protein
MHAFLSFGYSSINANYLFMTIEIYLLANPRQGVIAYEENGQVLKENLNLHQAVSLFTDWPIQMALTGESESCLFRAPGPSIYSIRTQQVLRLRVTVGLYFTYKLTVLMVGNRCISGAGMVQSYTYYFHELTGSSVFCYPALLDDYVLSRKILAALCFPLYIHDCLDQVVSAKNGWKTKQSPQFLSAPVIMLGLPNPFVVNTSFLSKVGGQFHSIERFIEH